MTTILLRRLYDRFTPIDQEGVDLLWKLPINEVVRCNITIPRNLKFFRKFWALLDVAFDAWEMSDIEYKGVQVHKNKERFRKDVLIMAGFGYPVVNIKGEVRYEAKSISFFSMTDEEFSEVYSHVIDVILEKVLTHYTRDNLENVVSAVLAFT